MGKPMGRTCLAAILGVSKAWLIPKKCGRIDQRFAHEGAPLKRRRPKFAACHKFLIGVYIKLGQTVPDKSSRKIQAPPCHHPPRIMIPPFTFLLQCNARICFQNDDNDPDSIVYRGVTLNLVSPHIQMIFIASPKNQNIHVLRIINSTMSWGVVFNKAI
jgi:hypothetical protein